MRRRSCIYIPSLSYFLNSATNSDELKILFPLNCVTTDISLFYSASCVRVVKCCCSCKTLQYIMLQNLNNFSMCQSRRPWITRAQLRIGYARYMQHKAAASIVSQSGQRRYTCVYCTFIGLAISTLVIFHCCKSLYKIPSKSTSQLTRRLLRC